MHYTYKRHIYSLCQNLSLNVNSINKNEEISLYCRKIEVSLIKEKMNTLSKEDIKIK